MTWAYTGSEQVQVDLFDIKQPAEPRVDAVPDAMGWHVPEEVPLSEVEERAEDRAEVLADQLYNSAPDPVEERQVFGSRVRGEWVTADLVAPSDVHLLLGMLDQPLPLQDLRTIRRGRNVTPQARIQDPIQIAIMQRILIVVARQATSPPSWAEIINRLQ